MTLLEKLRSARSIAETKEKIKNMFPMAVFYDMCHFSAQQKIKNGERATNIFQEKIEKSPDLSPFSLARYREETTDRQIILHGKMYQTLLNIYLAHSKRNTYLVEKRLSCEEYERLPKQYRGLFYKKTNQIYVLNMPLTDMAIACNKKNQEKLNELLNRADNLIPFVLGSINPELRKKQLKDRVNSIEALYDIFIEIAKISTPVKTTKNDDKYYSARRLYNEYLSESQKKRFLKAQTMLRLVKATKIKKTAEAMVNIEKWYQARRLSELHYLNIKTK